MTRSRWTTIRAGVAAVLMLGLTAASCGGETDPAPTSETTAPSTAVPSTTAMSPESARLLNDPDAVISPVAFALRPPDHIEATRAYVRAEQAWIKAGMVPVNPDHPDLAATTGGKVLENVRRVTQEALVRGEAYQAPAVFVVEPTSVDVGSASTIIDACVAQDISLVDMHTGQVRDSQAFSVNKRVLLERVNGAWLVTRAEKSSDYRDGITCVR